jgi:hypothetical protein
MASTPSSELAPVVAMDPDGAADRPLSQRSHFCWGQALAAGRASLRCPGRKLPRLLLGGDVIALCAAFLRAQLVFETLTLTDSRCSSSASHSGSCSPMDTGSYYLDRYRADYGAADDIKPLATHAEGEGRWNRCCRVEANPAPPSPWRCQRVREIERPLRRLRYDTGPHDGLFERRTHAVTYAGKATVAAKAVEPLRTTYATRAECTRARLLCCRARAVSVGARPWVMDVR